MKTPKLVLIGIDAADSRLVRGDSASLDEYEALRQELIEALLTL
jgi:hypothetical protein